MQVMCRWGPVILYPALVGAAAGAAGGFSGESAPQEEVSITRWVRLAETYARRVHDADGQFAAWIRLSELHAKRRNLAAAQQAVLQIEDRALREAGFVFLTRTVAEQGDYECALRLAESRESVRQRDVALCRIARIASSRHNFKKAETAIELVRDWGLQQELWYGLACKQADAGEYGLALATADRLPTEGFGRREDKMKLLEAIAEAKRTMRRESPLKTAQTIADVVRDFGGSWPAPDPERLPALRKKVKQTANATERTLAWYLMGRAHHEQGRNPECRQAVQNGVGEVAAVSNAYDRLLYAMLLADLAIRVGELEEARQLAGATLTPEALAAAFEEEDRFGLGPKVVAVQMRLGDVPRAFETASRTKPPHRQDAWWTLGAFCALEGKTQEAEMLLDRISCEEHAALLCTGVAAGLLEGSASGQ